MTSAKDTPDSSTAADVVPLPTASLPSPEFAQPGAAKAEYTDGRLPGDWKTKYPAEARRCINQEALILSAILAVVTFLSGLFLSLSGHSWQIPLSFLISDSDPIRAVEMPRMNIVFQLVATYFVGSLGGTTFSIKWLVHSVAKSKWHLDRRYWRLFVPFIGGIYACVVLTLLDGGLLGSQASASPRSGAATAALAFMIGYFSDGVSGLLSNIANAVFGTLEKK
ncbi:hypothetical protein AB4Z01_00730 [Inquilinus sp. YAF38]|uniref:hypothetical protein n=1 Tax=Inquilinus sp. YAF38 TaxID=3233084 RepID=UPI003F92A44D